MKKSLALMIVLLILVLCGCGNATEPGTVIHSNDVYSIIENDGEYAIRFHNPNQTAASGDRFATSIKFASPGEMIDAVESGKYFVSHLYTIKGFARNSAGDLVLYDINSLYDAVLPDGLQYDNVAWSGGKSYTFVWEGDTTFGRLQVDSEAAVKEVIESTFYIEKGKATILSTETVSDRNATVVHYLNLGDEPCKSVRYTYKDNGKDITVSEYYDLNISDSVPNCIYVGGSVDGTYFYVTLNDLTERPSYEWITSFGLKPYVETATE